MLVVVGLSVVFESLGSSMLVIAVGTAVKALGTVTEASELVVEVLSTNQVFSKRPWDRILRRHTFSGGLAG